MLSELATTLLHFLWQAAVIGGAAALGLRRAGPVASRIRYRIAIGALVLMTASTPISGPR